MQVCKSMHNISYLLVFVLSCVVVLSLKCCACLHWYMRALHWHIYMRALHWHMRALHWHMCALVHACIGTCMHWYMRALHWHMCTCALHYNWHMCTCALHWHMCTCALHWHMCALVHACIGSRAHNYACIALAAMAHVKDLSHYVTNCCQELTHESYN